MTTPQQGMEVVGQHEGQQFSPEDLLHMGKFVGALDRAITGEPLGETEVIIQPDGYSEHSEAIRDAIVEEIGRRAGFDVDDHLTVSEKLRRERGADLFTVQPWMKQVLGMTDPEKPSLLTGVVHRDAVLAETPDITYLLHEVEIPNTLVLPEGNVSRMNRLMFYSSRPTF